MGRLLAIGDIHGCRQALATLLAEVNPSTEDTIVVLGDVIDRGHDSKGVIDDLMDLSKNAQVVAIRGNHEIMMLQARQSRVALFEWCGFGGDATLDSFGAETLDDIPESHWQFLEATKPFYESKRHFFVHAKAYADLWLSDQPDHALFWETFESPPPEPHCSGKVMICGHTSQRSGVPKDLGHAVCIDTAVCKGGWLTCLNVDTMCYWQATEGGELREESLPPR